MRTAAIVIAFAAAVCLLLATGKIAVTAYQAAKTAVAGDTDLAAIVTATIASTSIADLATIALPAIATATVLLASHRYGLFREGKPHLNITQRIYCQSLGESYRLVAIKAMLHNNSKVLVRPHRAVCLLQQTSPIDDGDVVAIYLERIKQSRIDVHEYPRWNLCEIIKRCLKHYPDVEPSQHGWWNLGEVIKHWPKRDLAIEPGERHPVLFEFIISRDTSCIRVATAVHKGKNDVSWMSYDYLNIDTLTAGGIPNGEPEQTGE